MATADEPKVKRVGAKINLDRFVHDIAADAGLDPLESRPVDAIFRDDGRISLIIEGPEQSDAETDEPNDSDTDTDSDENVTHD